MTPDEVESGVPPGAENFELNKTVYEYSQRLFESQIKGAEMLEVKARFCLTVLSIVIGGLLLKLDMYQKLFEVIAAQNTTVQILMYTEVFILAFSTAGTAIYVLRAMFIRQWRTEVGPSFYDDVLTQRDVWEFYRDFARNYLIAWDSNRKVIAKKSKMVLGATRLLSVTLISLFSLIFTFAPALAHS